MSLLHVAIGPSQRLRGLAGLVHVLAAFALWLAVSPRSIPFTTALLLALAAHAVWQDMQLRAPTVNAFEADDDGCRVRWRGAWHPARVREALVTEFLTVVHLSAGKRRIDLVLLADSVDAEAFRQLRVWLRWHGDSSGSGF